MPAWNVKPAFSCKPIWRTPVLNFCNSVHKHYFLKTLRERISSFSHIAKVARILPNT